MMGPTLIGSTQSGRLVEALADIVGAAHVHVDPATCITYSFDAYFQRAVPPLVVAPESSEQLARVVRLLSDAGLRFLVRGRGTGYAGGSVPVNGEVVILTTRLNRIREVNVQERWLVAEAGVITATVQHCATRVGLRYPADPSSYAISTIGGNIATNAGGPHCLGYGVTSNYVLELECVSATGEIYTLGNSAGLATGLDLRGIVIGSEGTLAIITAVKLRLVLQPEVVRTIYARFDHAGECFPALCDIFEQGLMPIALDMTADVIHPAGHPLPFSNDALLYIEIDGDAASVEDRTRRLCEVLAEHPCDVDVQAKNDLMRKRFLVTQERWRGITQILKQPSYFLFDAVVRRSDLAQMFDYIGEEARRFGFIVANTFHAGDGNIHPTPFYDPRTHGIFDRLEEFRDAILGHVARHEGALSGEHGIGLEKRHQIPNFFGRPAQQLQLAVMGAFQRERMLGDGKLLPDAVGEEGPPPRLTLRTPGIRAVDGYAVFDAGISLGDVRTALTETPYQFAYEPIGMVPAMPLGEALLSGRPGLRDGRFGPARDLLLGGVIESRQGVECEFGSVYAKDVSGLDIRKLVFGSQGRLGRLLQVAVKLLPRDELSLLCTVQVCGAEDAQARLRQLQIVGGPVHGQHLVRQDGAYRLAFLLEGNAATVKSALKTITERFAGAVMTAVPWDGIPLCPNLRLHEMFAWHIAPLGDAPGMAIGADFIALAHPTLVGIAAPADPTTVTDDLPSVAQHILETVYDL